ncbi:unnamed protein product [Ectocarpus sp. CCAP 1310/34]|nr:unnamed protein product [Ectocarpus sp. CCAP 1310/34]
MAGRRTGGTTPDGSQAGDTNSSEQIDSMRSEISSLTQQMGQLVQLVGGLAARIEEKSGGATEGAAESGGAVESVATSTAGHFGTVQYDGSAQAADLRRESGPSGRHSGEVGGSDPQEEGPLRHGLERGRTLRETRELQGPEEPPGPDAEPDAEQALLAEIIVDYVSNSLVRERYDEEQVNVEYRREMHELPYGTELQEEAFGAEAGDDGSSQTLHDPQLSIPSPFGQKPSDVEWVPLTYKDVLNSKYKVLWEAAIAKEFDGHKKTGTFSEISGLPEGRKAISAKWIFSHKTNEKGLIVDFKARMVARGFSQVPGVDFHHSSSACPSAVSIKTMVAVSTENGVSPAGYEHGRSASSTGGAVITSGPRGGDAAPRPAKAPRKLTPKQHRPGCVYGSPTDPCNPAERCPPAAPQGGVSFAQRAENLRVRGKTLRAAHVRMHHADHTIPPPQALEQGRYCWTTHKTRSDATDERVLPAPRSRRCTCSPMAKSLNRLGVFLVHNFAVTSHFKGAHDGIGGLLKALMKEAEKRGFRIHDNAAAHDFLSAYAKSKEEDEGGCLGKWSPYKIANFKIELIGANQIRRPRVDLTGIRGTSKLYQFMGAENQDHRLSSSLGVEPADSRVDVVAAGNGHG